MPARALSSATISFGLVAIPVKLFTAASSEQVRFNMLHDKCSGRVKQQYYCPTDDEVVDRKQLVKGYEYARGQYVRFDPGELEKLEVERTNSIEIVEFVPLSSVDFVQVEKSYYLGPDKGGDKPYQLLSEVMQEKGVVAVGRWAARGKDQLVLLRPYGEDGLILHQLYYANEVRAFDEIDTGASFDFKKAERDLAKKLVDELTVDAFDAEQFEDTYRARVLEAVEQKVEGEEITVAPEAPKAQIIDLFEALKKSLSDAEKSGPGPKKAKARKTEAKKGVKKASSRSSKRKKSSTG